MKLIFQTSLLLLLSLIFSPASHGQEVIAFWDFNEDFDVRDNDPLVQIVHEAIEGQGTLYQQRADLDGNGAGSGAAFVDAALGINAEAGRAIKWDDVAKSGDNDAELFLSFSTTGFEDIQITFDILGNDGDGITRYDLKYDTNSLEDIEFLAEDSNDVEVSTMIKDFAGGNSTDFANNVDIITSATAFSRTTLDLSTFIDVNNQSTVAFRIDDIRENDDITFDNFLVTGTSIAVPEPSSAALAISACAGVLLRRRR